MLSLWKQVKESLSNLVLHRDGKIFLNVVLNSSKMISEVISCLPSIEELLIYLSFVLGVSLFENCV